MNKLNRDWISYWICVYYHESSVIRFVSSHNANPILHFILGYISDDLAYSAFTKDLYYRYARSPCSSTLILTFKDQKLVDSESQSNPELNQLQNL